MRHSILVLLGSWLPGEKLRELSVKVDEILGVFSSFKFVLLCKLRELRRSRGDGFDLQSSEVRCQPSLEARGPISRLFGRSD